MKPVKIITDTCSDLTPALLEEYGVDYALMSTVFEGKTTPASLAWTAEDVHAFYNLMREGRRITTTQVPVEEFHRIFTKYLDEGYDIVYIGCSTKQSGSVNTAHVLAEKLMKERDGAKIYCIDSLNASLGEGMLALEASKMAKNGICAEEIVEKITGMRKKVNEFVTVHSLDALRRAGRVKGAAAFFGNLMGVKPIIISDKNGEQTPVKKVKGRATSIREIIAMTGEVIENPQEQTVWFVHADCAAEEVETITKMIREQIPCRNVVACYMGPIIGASIGPDAIGIFSFGKEVTYAVGE